AAVEQVSNAATPNRRKRSPAATRPSCATPRPTPTTSRPSRSTRTLRPTASPASTSTRSSGSRSPSPATSPRRSRTRRGPRSTPMARPTRRATATSTASFARTASGSSPPTTTPTSSPPGPARRAAARRRAHRRHPPRPPAPRGPRPAPSGAEPGPSGATTGPSTATTAPAPPTGRARSRSSNWAGYAATGGSFTAVSGTWAVPHPATTGAAGESAVWVGIGGENSRDLIQAGTEEIVSGTGQVRYDAWVETLPAAPRQVPFVVRPGDTVSVSIVQQSGDSWTVSFANATTGAAYQQNVQYRSSLSSAEWIVEAPGGFRGQTGPLDDFGTVTFTSCSAVADGKTVNLADAGARPITLVGRGELPLATTSPLTPDGAGFTVTRANAAQPPAPATSRRGG